MKTDANGKLIKYLVTDQRIGGRMKTPEECQHDEVYCSISPAIISAIHRYIHNKLPPGDFLTAVICNDLKGAMGRADLGNRRTLHEIVMYFYNEVPSTAWGSVEKFDAWLSG